MQTKQIIMPNVKPNGQWISSSSILCFISIFILLIYCTQFSGSCSVREWRRKREGLLISSHFNFGNLFISFFFLNLSWPNDFTDDGKKKIVFLIISAVGLSYLMSCKFFSFYVSYIHYYYYYFISYFSSFCARMKNGGI